MIYCSNCGKELAGDAKFCSGCGAAVEQKNSATTGDNLEKKNAENRLNTVSAPNPSSESTKSSNKKNTAMILIALIILLLLIVFGLVLYIVIGNKSKSNPTVMDDISTTSIQEQKTNELIETQPNTTAIAETSLQEELWYDENGVKIICKKYGLNLSTYPSIQFELYVENNTEKSIWAGIKEDYLNGWKIGTTGNFCDNGLAPGMKTQQTQNVYIYDCGIEDITEVKDYEFTLWVDLDSNDYSNNQIEIQKRFDTFPMIDGTSKPSTFAFSSTNETTIKDVEGIAFPLIWYNDKGVKISCEYYGRTEDNSKLKFDFIVENETDKAIWAGLSDDYLNGWKIGTTGNFCKNGLAPHKKIHQTETIDLKDIEIKDETQVKNYQFILWVDLDSEDYGDTRIELEKEIASFPVIKTND